jgi:lysozyme family protein
VNFDQAFERLLGHEGVLSMDPNDRGNWTGGQKGVGTLKGSKYGISAMSYPNEDIANLTVERAKAIYARDFWGPAGCDAVPAAARFDLFDFAVNSGVTTAVRNLQRACGADVDGKLGPRTLSALQAMHPARFIARFNGHRLLFMADLKAWETQGRGWARRVGRNLVEA